MSQVFITKNLDQAGELFDSAGLGKIVEPNDFVALKIHFGERGNKAYIKPDRAKPIVKKVRALKGKPFWTDCNTLYNGSRANTLDHLQTAFDHGYTSGKTGAHVLLADGLKGKNYIELPVSGKHFKRIYVGALVKEMDAVIAVTHFKGHEVTGFGGAIKNISMGFASRLGKLKMHQDCKNCDEIKTCRRNQTLESCWVGPPDLVQEKIAEYAAGVQGHFKNKIAYLSFISDVSENCDCYGHNSLPIIPDVGILASFDPVALDQACVDLLNKTDGRIKGRDKLRTIWPNVDWSIQLKHAEELGLGSRKYELVSV